MVGRWGETVGAGRQWVGGGDSGQVGGGQRLWMVSLETTFIGITCVGITIYCKP